jgi:hypothetical protein
VGICSGTGCWHAYFAILRGLPFVFFDQVLEMISSKNILICNNTSSDKNEIKQGKKIKEDCT